MATMMIKIRLTKCRMLRARIKIIIAAIAIVIAMTTKMKLMTTIAIIIIIISTIDSMLLHVIMRLHNTRLARLTCVTCMCHMARESCSPHR